MSKINFESYAGKTVLITGASSGIGESFAKNLAESGANLVLTARSTDKLKSLAKELKTHNISVSVFSQDLSIPGSAEKLYTEIKKAGIEIDLIINNAGYGRWGEFGSIERADYASMIQLNIVSLTELCHLFLADMSERANGGVINIASTAAFGPVPYGTVYSSTKAYVLTFTEALNYEYRESGVNIMALCPGATKSEFMNVAAGKSELVRENTKNRLGDMSFQTSEEVVVEGLTAFSKGKIYHISGSKNRRMYAVMKHFSRKFVLNAIGKMFGKVVRK